MIPELIVDIVSGVFLAIGSFFLVVGSLGLLRMPDVFTRMHATSVSDTMGAGFLILGMIIQAGFTLVTVKLLIILLIFFFTGPLTTHALARGALAVGLKPVLFDRNGRKRAKEQKLVQEFGVVEVRDQPPARPTDPARAEKKAAAKTRKPAKSRSRKSAGGKSSGGKSPGGRGGSSSKR